ncbi:MAG: hypothetical protein PVG66_14290 [Chromatiales bacterium]|jgi:hypothetical protein
MHKKLLHKGDIVEFFHRHVVPIYFDFEKNGEHTCFLITSFVLSVYDQWFLVTAGHCIEDIEKLKTHGYTLRKCRLIDSMGAGAEHWFPIPFGWDSAAPTKMCYDEAYDYGLIFLDDNIVELLQSNSIIPMAEPTWDKEPSKPEFYALIGVPDELSKSDKDLAKITTTWHIVDELPERPAAFQPTDAPTFWGRIRLTNELDSIVGMSGGPIFSFGYDSDGNLRYWLHAVQSRWIKSEKVVAACLMQPMARFLKEVLEGKHRDKYESKGHMGSE